MRIFIAAQLPTAINEALAQTSAMLRESVRGKYVPPDSFHLTLAFLGEIPGSRLPALHAAVEEAYAGATACECTLGDLGMFGRRNSATVWQGVEGDCVTKLAKSLRASLDTYGFDYDETKFLPHVTLMRRADLDYPFTSLPSPELASGTIDTVVIYQSELDSERAHYTPLYEVYLD
ncbi:MAG: RNA 2',3'-cyclic phosphodiesterase [Actinomycetaceae bacterium]|nr:RNA 2',3'-cyclic phosphodiesterase [Actinomycetaceae bacterium]